MFAYFFACSVSMIGIKENKCFSLLKFTGYLVGTILVPFFIQVSVTI